jgi:tRNA threonylcarbamoyladenosine biosynthesis protein TsaB
LKTLAIETSGAVGSAAAFADRRLAAEASLEEGMAHGRRLVPLLDEVVVQAGWHKRELDLVVVGLGPGSFTGLRVGLACAKTLAYALGIPLVGVCSLDAMARNAPERTDRVLTALDAKRGEVYAAAYARRADGLERTRGPALVTPDAAATWCATPFLVLGDALRKHAKPLTTGGGAPGDADLWRVRAETVGRLGIAAHAAGERTDPWTAEPIYLRLPDAEEKRLARERRPS